MAKKIEAGVRSADINNKLVEEILSQSNPKELFGKDGLFQQLKKRLVERILEDELSHELGYSRHSKASKQDSNRRNGTSEKTVIDDSGQKIVLDIPRDRDNSFEPQLIPKGVRRFTGFDDSVISLYARGMTMSEIQSHLEEMYHTEVSKELISTITDGVMEEVIRWQARALDRIYPIVYLDCIMVKARDNNIVINKAVYVVIGINIEGKKELLGIWISKNEGSKFWMQVVSELKNRGVEQIYVACVDGLKGFRDAINSVFPNTIVQLCIVHMVRNSLKYVSYKNLKEVAADLKQIYTANNENMANLALEEFAKKWDSKYPVISDIWIRNWSGIVPFFAFPKEIRKVIYTTNTIESVNRQIRKIIKNKGVFPDDKSITKIVYLALKHAAKKWTMPIKEWSLALNQFEILCGNFKYELLENDF
ncbi:transposase [Rickettsia sp. MEAM1 (Bemisia tabaci)]|uniref:IS256 family transposase n=4 Tax=unclassified Rickettsia TaxID=114295 RepID=UPI000BAADFA6|nr:IS256 family transposase [Rickettsia sp. MEAM1 (Bemisia tabaci)]ASX28021.1 transposase [Rickettsia sp. MEAM1 (Bemisia tabaci)]